MGPSRKVLLVAWGQDANFIRPTSAIKGYLPSATSLGGFDQNGNQICETVTWSNDLPYVIYGYGVVDSCNTLIIEPGVRCLHARWRPDFGCIAWYR
jgi:hypothetical protein